MSDGSYRTSIDLDVKQQSLLMRIDFRELGDTEVKIGKFVEFISLAKGYYSETNRTEPTCYSTINEPVHEISNNLTF